MRPKVPFVPARKMGMTTVFDERDRRRGVTVLAIQPAKVVAVRTAERDGYDAVQVGYSEVPMDDLTQPARGHQAPAVGDGPGYKVLREVRLDGPSPLEAGEDLGVPLEAGDRVIVRGVSKGRGFTGVMRRHNFTGGGRAHGQSGVTRRPLSAGAMGPARIWPGQKMPGRHGGLNVEERNAAVVEVDLERGLLAIEGGVPGPRGAFVEIYPLAERFEAWLDTRAEEPEEPVAEEAPEEPEAAAEATEETAPESEAEAAAGDDEEEKAE